MKIRLQLIGLACILFITPILSHAQTSCVQPSRLITGESGMVTPGSGNNVRVEPNLSASLAGKLGGSQTFDVIGGAVCDETYVWVQVETDLFTGWTVEATDDEYWLQPVTGEIYADDAISVMIPETLATDVIFAIQPEVEAMGGLRPIRQELILLQEIEPERAFPAHSIIVTPISEISIEDWQMGAEAVVETLNLVELNMEFDEQIMESLNMNQAPRNLFFPQDPYIVGARRVLIVSPHYVDMANGRGIAFVTMYSQDLLPPTNESVFYNFVGITDDEQYLVTVQYKVRTDMLIESLDDFNFPSNWEDSYITYMQQATESLNTLSPDEWFPSLDDLDTIVNSIHITGGFENEG